jgi:hypothetical protein
MFGTFVGRIEERTEGGCGEPGSDRGDGEKACGEA